MAEDVRNDAMADDDIVAEETVSERPAGAADVDPDSRSRDRTNLKNLKAVGAWHGTASIAALTLFGAGHTWAVASGWPLAAGVSVAAAVVAGVVLSSIVHEWSHFAGAWLSGSRLKVAEKPVRLFFMFNFDMQANSVRQALWMSWGGVLGSWLVVLLAFLMVPMDSWASAALGATLVGRAFNASYFELPVIRRTRESGEFEKALRDRLSSPGVVQVPGLIVGLLAFALLS